MKRIFFALIFCIILANANFVRALGNEQVNDNENESKSQNSEEIVEKRDQNIFVPTDKGVQRATLSEVQKIKELEAKKTEELCESYLLGDFKSREILSAYNIDTPRAMASTSKLVSLYVVFDQLKAGKINKSDMVKIDHETEMLPGSTYKLKEGDEVSVEDLIKASIVISGNDAITALAKHIGGSTQEFAHLMNEKCRELGLKNAHMINPTGLTDYLIEDYNRMTTREMFILSAKLIEEHPEILNYSKIKSIKKGEELLEYSTNPLLGILSSVDGLKTGYTNAAGRCLIATGEQKKLGDLPIRLIAITTGSKSDWERFVAAKRILKEGLEKYSYKYLKSDQTEIEIENAADEKIAIKPREMGEVLYSSDDKIESSIKPKPNLVAPMEENEVVGQIIYYKNGDEIFRTEMLTAEKVYEKSLITKFFINYREIFANI